MSIKQAKQENMTTSIQLQSVGRVPAQPAMNIVKGSQLMWNFAQTSTVIDIVKETAKTIVIKEQCDRSGSTHERRLNKTRLVAIMPSK